MKKTTLCYIEKDNKYLMLYRNKKENDLNEGKWVGVGGKFEQGESPDECLLREVYEETGFTLTDYRFRGLIRFVSDIWGEEFMYLYSATGFRGDLKDCDEGDFSWIEKTKVYDLPIWEGDKCLFDALEKEEEFFTMEVVYEGDTLVNKPVCVPSPVDLLYEHEDKKYSEFQAKLVPNIPADTVIGVRIPTLRRLAKEYSKTKGCQRYLETLPHTFYDENIFHAIILSETKDYDEAVEKIEAFLRYIDNWAVCDTLCPKAFKKNKAELLKKIKLWTKSKHVYTCRFGLKMLMTHFLDSDFKPGYLEIAASVKLTDYYIKMMIAWFFATALAKQWEHTLPYISEKRLEKWTHNKAIQKARESYRITPEQKELLKQLKQ